MDMNEMFHEELTPQEEYRVKYNEKRALTLVICLFVFMILILLTGVYLAATP